MTSTLPQYVNERMEDRLRADFLRTLDAAPFEVTAWEEQFLEDFLKSPRPFTERQREAVDGMWAKYGPRL